MPSYFKYRIKHASESNTSLYTKELIPEDAYKNLQDSDFLSSEDENIKPHTCAYIRKVRVEQTWYYLCGIRIWSGRSDLIHSAGTKDPKAPNTPDGSLQSRVSGAEDTGLGPEYYTHYLQDGTAILQRNFPSGDYFGCKYCDKRSGKATTRTIGGQGEPIVEFPMCNCYSPRGGLQITLFDGAIKGHLAAGYTYSKEAYMPPAKKLAPERNLGDVYTSYNKDTPLLPPTSFPGPVPANVSKELKDKFPTKPGSIGALYMLLNARANIAPCCWWKNPYKFIYRPEYFTVIDLAVAQKNAEMRLGQYGNLPDMSRNNIESDTASYITVPGDYYIAGDQLFNSAGELAPISEADAYMLNIMLGRNYDYTLPDTANNRRIIYTLNQGIVGLPTKRIRDEDRDASPPAPEVWHYDMELGFSPKFCGHPDCTVKYTWGHVCNGGGSYSLADGTACPYYENPLLGDKDSEKFSKLQNMYPGDTINGAILLELMWLCKGGYPWTEEEWKETWATPYIWTTMPYNPVFYQTDKWTDNAGNVVKGDMHYEYNVYSRKAKIDPATGKIELKPIVKLPGGSVAAFQRRKDQTLEDGLRIPSAPSIIQSLELRAFSSVRITWPTPDVNVFTLDISNTEEYTQKIKEAKNKTYNRLIGSKKGLSTLVMGHAETLGAIYCVNTAFLQGGGWDGKREDLEKKLINLETGTKACQKLLKELWRDLSRAESAGSDPILKNAGLLKTTTTVLSSMFIFTDVPLSLLDETNHIIVFSFVDQKIDADIVKVKPIFRRGYAYQKDTTLMTSWKTVWNGRPSVFLQEKHLASIREPLDKGRPQISKGTSKLSVSGDNVLTISSNNSALYAKIDSLMSELQSSITSLQNITNEVSKFQITLQINERFTDLNRSFASLVTNVTDLYSTKAGNVTNSTEKKALIKEIEEEIESVRKKESTANYLVSTYTNAKETGLVNLYSTASTGWGKVKSALNTVLNQVNGMPQETPDPDKSKTDGVSKRYSYKDLSKDSGKGDFDTNEDGVIVTEKEYDPEKNIEPVDRLYIPYFTGYKPNHRDLKKYGSINSFPSQDSEYINLDIPEKSGLAEWGHMVVSQDSTTDLIPSYSFPSKAAKKIVVYSTRDSDDASGSSGGTPKGQKLTDEVGKWYKFPSCASLVMFVMNPEIFNNFTEAMIFSISAKVKYRYKDAQGNDQTSSKTIKFMPIDYSQVPRKFPGYTEGNITRNLGSESKHGMNYHKIEINEDIAILEKEEKNRHPWIFFGIPVVDTTDVREWRFYNNIFYTLSQNISTAVLPSPKNKDDIEIYIEYAYIAEIYDENAAEAYAWDGGSVKTRILMGHPKAGILKTVFNYNGKTDYIDGFNSVPMVSHTMATMWPYARSACRDYEITYIWRDVYRGEELTTGNMKNRTMTNWAATVVANKTVGKDKTYTQMCIGDHDLGTEFQPKISFNTKTSTNVTAGIRFKVAKAEWSTTFTDKTDQYLENIDPTYGFPKEYVKVSSLPPAPSQPSSMGALYFPYTRSEPGSAYVPRHRTYLWDFLDRWRNKLNKDKSLFGGFRLQATDWCVRGAVDAVRVRVWKRHWMYDPRRETKFLGRSRTRGPVFQLEYRDYYEMPTKTVFLRPYVASTGGEGEDCFCPTCNKYFKRTTTRCADSVCPFPEHKQPAGDNSKPTEAANRNAHWMTMLEKIESATTAEVTETLTEYERKVFVPVNPDRQDYKIWRERVIKLYNEWKASSSDESTETKKLNALQREQAKGRRYGWIANIYGTSGVEFVNDTTTKAASLIEEASENSEIDMATGCDKFGLAKRRDLGSFQMSDGYVPGSVDPYLGTDPNSEGELEYFKLKDEARKAESAYQTAKGATDKYKSKQEIMNSNPRTTFSEEGTVYSQNGGKFPSSGNSPTVKISDKVAETQKVENEKKAASDKAKAKLAEINSKTARGQARADLEAKADAKRAEVQKRCARYYEYQQQSYGYNYPWSPYDSPPVFGNIGREMYVIELCTVGSKISWLPRPYDSKMKMPLTKTQLSFPAIPSWWTSLAPEGAPKELVTLLAPPAECTRALTPLHSEAQNPLYNYIFTGYPFDESSPSSTIHYAKYLRIVTEYDPNHSGEPGYRSDAGRFTLVPTRSGSMMQNIYVSDDTPSYKDATQDEFGLVTAFAADKTTESTTSATPEMFINGNEVKGFSIPKGGTVNVGDYYPGFEGPYNYGKFFTALRVPSAHWAWPEAVRDKIERAQKVVKYYADLLEPPVEKEVVAKPKYATETYTLGPSEEIEYITSTSDKQGIWAIPSIECAPYFQKKDVMDDGREVSGGPELDEDTGYGGKKTEERRFKDTHFGIVVESERSEGGQYRPPLIWVERLGNGDLSGVSSYREPSSNSQVHRVSESGDLQPVSMKERERKEGDKSSFSNGEISNISNMVNPSKGANLFTSKAQNESGYWPGFKVGKVSYKALGKVFNDKELDSTIYGNYRVKKEMSIAGQNNHRLTAEITMPNFGANLNYIKLELASALDGSSLDNYFNSISDSLALKVVVTGSPIPGDRGSYSPVAYANRIIKLPLEDPTEGLTIDLDFDMTTNIIISLQFLVTTDPGNFLIGPWKGIETKSSVVSSPQYDSQGKYTGMADELKTVPNRDNFCYLKDLITKVTLGVLSPGKCIEVVKVSEAGFYVSLGSASDVDYDTYHFPTQSKSKYYKTNWEEYDKKLDKEEGWWKDSGRIQTSDASIAGVKKQWEIAAEEKMIENWRKTEGADSQFGKEPRATVYPKACIEIPELPVSRLKIDTWNRLNTLTAPTVKNIKDDEAQDSYINDSWMLGGVWATRAAGPEWVTQDEYPSRDIIWWPALPYDQGRVILKGRAFAFGRQYKDEAVALSTKKKRLVELNDTYNEFAYKYEVRGFDALYKKIQVAEQQGAEERKNAATARQYGTTYRNNYNQLQKQYDQATDARNMMNSMGSMGSSFGWLGPALTSPANNLTDLMGQQLQALAMGQSKNYRTTMNQTWVLMDEVAMKVDEVTWDSIKEREDMQEKLYTDEIKKVYDRLDTKDDSLTFRAIIPHFDMAEIGEITGINNTGFTKRGLATITREELDKQREWCIMRWKTWSWDEVVSFTFRNEFTNRYPMTTGTAGGGWSNILLRKCGTRWVHKDQDIDGGQIWEKWDEEWKKVVNDRRHKLKKGVPTIAITDCKKINGESKDCIKEQQDVNDYAANSGYIETGGRSEGKSLGQKWEAQSISLGTCPKDVSADGGSSFKRPDPWWRY
jgi:hypothetical protein